MTRSIPYLLLGFLFLGCGSKWNKRLSLWRNDKIPYGTYYAYRNLVHFFGDATIEPSSSSPEIFYQSDDSTAAYIVIGESVRPDENELRAILHHAYSGNKVFISAMYVGSNLLDSLKLKISASSLFLSADSLTTSILDPSTFDSLTFSYPGAGLGNHFTGMDSSITEVLGKDARGKANFVRFTYGGTGAILLHLAPTAFTNFFLLHKQNKKYYDLAISYIPETVNKVRWDDYFRHHSDGIDKSEQSGFSKLRAFMDHEVLRWAFWLTLLLSALVYLVESKRKQRVVPIRPELNNSSLDFVKTVGRLYYQRKDNKNLAEKMITHFLAHVRSRYNIPTSELTLDFGSRLAFKSGYPGQSVERILKYIHTIQGSAEVSDQELLSFNQELEIFYKQT